MNEIRPLTFFRFLTAFIVFWFHTKIHLNVSCSVEIIDRFVLQGAVFMSAFFMLSGFVLTFSYINNDFLLQSNRKNFYIKRIAKIYPAYCVTVVLSYIFVNNVTLTQGIVMIPMSLLGLQSLFFSTFPYLLNGGLWSLSVEAFFYLLFPIIAELFKKYAKYYKLILLISYLFTLYPSIVQCYFGGTCDLYINPLFRLPEFIIGMCLAYMYLHNKHKKKNGFSIIFSFSIFIILIELLSKNKFLNHIPFNNNYCYYNCVVFPFIGFFMYELARTGSDFILKITNNSLSNYLGKISYSFYLTQFLAICVIGKKYFNNLGIISFISTLALNIFFAILMYEFIEKKYQLRIKEYFLIKV